MSQQHYSQQINGENQIFITGLKDKIFIHILESYSAVESNKQLVHAKTWSNLENTTAHERSQILTVE